MNYIKHLAGFFTRVSNDDRLNPTHISMYVSLFQFWNASRFQNPISISRNELMKVSKISAKATYHKCMKDLNDFGYLKYKPSYNPFKGSLVYLFNFQAGSELPIDTHHTKNETGAEQAQEPYINVSKHIKQNIVNKHKQAQNTGVQNLNTMEIEEKEKLRQKKKKKIGVVSIDNYPDSAKKQRKKFVAPELSQVEEYFVTQRFALVEAQKFHNHFQSNGWLVGGRTQMVDWKAAARNWMLNAKKFANGKQEKPTPKHLHATTHKNYSESL